MDYNFTQKPRRIVFKRIDQNNILFRSTTETLNFRISHVKIVQDSNKQSLHIVAFLNKGFLFEHELIEVENNVHCGYWKHPAAHQYRFFILRLISENKAILNYYPQRLCKTDNPVSLAMNEIKKRGL